MNIADLRGRASSTQHARLVGVSASLGPAWMSWWHARCFLVVFQPLQLLARTVAFVHGVAVTLLPLQAELEGVWIAHLRVGLDVLSQLLLSRVERVALSMLNVSELPVLLDVPSTRHCVSHIIAFTMMA